MKSRRTVVAIAALWLGGAAAAWAQTPADPEYQLGPPVSSSDYVVADPTHDFLLTVPFSQFAAMEDQIDAADREKQELLQEIDQLRGEIKWKQQLFDAATSLGIEATYAWEACEDRKARVKP